MVQHLKLIIKITSDQNHLANPLAHLPQIAIVLLQNIFLSSHLRLHPTQRIVHSLKIIPTKSYPNGLRTPPKNKKRKIIEIIITTHTQQQKTRNNNPTTIKSEIKDWSQCIRTPYQEQCTRTIRTTSENQHGTHGQKLKNTQNQCPTQRRTAYRWKKIS